MTVSVVIPAMNEEETISGVIKGALPYADEVWVIDGGSTDGTRERAEEAGASVAADDGRGKGAAMRKAAEVVSGDIIVFMDADGSHDPADIPRLVKPILDRSADHVSGSRLLGGSSELHGTFGEFLRLAGSAFATACINWRWNVRLSESQNGFRAMSARVLRSIPLTAGGFNIEQEMIMETLRMGYRMAEVPAHEHPRKGGESHINSLLAIPRHLFSLARGLLKPRYTREGRRVIAERGLGA